MSLELSSDTLLDIWWSLIAQFLANPTTLTSPLTQGQSYTQLTVGAMPVALPEGESIQLGNPADYLTQQVQLASSCNVGDTILNVVEFTADYGFADSTTILPLDSQQVGNAWPQDGSPSWSITQDVCFLRLTPQDNVLTETIDETWGVSTDTDVTVSQSYQRGWNLGLTFYGPSALDNANALRAWLLKPIVKDWLQSTAVSLGGAGLALIPRIRQPLKGPELYNSQWWQRVTMNVQSYELVQIDDEIPFISDSNNISINTSV